MRIPNVIELFRAEAGAALIAAGFVDGDITEVHSDTIPENVVIFQDPFPGEGVLNPNPVNLTVSLGPESLLAIPNLIGLDGASAVDAIKESGVETRLVSEEPSATVPEGHVISQTPDGGSVGSFIDVVVSSGICNFSSNS